MKATLIKKQTDNFIEHGRILWKSVAAEGVNVLDFQGEINAWVRASQAFFIEQFSGTELLGLVARIKTISLSDNINITNSHKVNNLKADLQALIKDNVEAVTYNSQMAQVSDTLCNPQRIVMERRSEFTIKDKRDFILKKLVEFGLEKPVNIVLLFKMNGIAASETETIENIDILIKKKLVTRVSEQSRLRIFVKISTIGREYIEELNRKKAASQVRIKKSQDENSEMTNYDVEVEQLKSLMTSAATDLAIDDQSEKDYKQLRQSLLKQDKFKTLAPKFVITCGTLREFKREMQGVSKQYAGRRSHIKEAFYALINSLYGGETMGDAIADIVQQVEFGQLNLLPQDIQDNGRKMSDVYLYLYCIENSLRIFIGEIMKIANVTIPIKVQETINKMKQSEQESKYLPVRGDNDLFYCDFIQLGKIIIANWLIFGKYFPNKNEHWLNVMIDELYKIRCLVAHNSFVGEHERQSLKVYYKNITLQLKL